MISKLTNKKSELVVLNEKKKDHDHDLNLVCKDRSVIKAKVKDETARFLGIWISEKNGQSCSIKLVEQEI